MKKILVIDGNSIMNRAFYGIRHVDLLTFILWATPHQQRQHRQAQGHTPVYSRLASS